MLRCKEASQLASKALDAELTFRERVGLRVHLFFCGACTRYRRQIELLHALLQRELERLPELVRLPGLGLTNEERESVVRALRVGGPPSEG